MTAPAIVVVGFDRPLSLARLLSSVARAEYSGADEVPLVISIDAGGVDEVRRVARSFPWRFGPVRVVEHESHLGLRDHILSCGDLSDEFGAVIVLEDDLYVSPAFYDYAIQVLRFYSGDSELCGASLYGGDFNEYARLRFAPMDDGFDNYFVRSASSWGQLWSRDQWRDFRTWLGSESGESHAGVPSVVTGWPESSWKKSFIRYMVERNKLMVYPRASLTTNFGDPGTHYPVATGDLQVPLRLRSAPLRLAKPQESLCIYDSYYELEASCLQRLNPDLAGFDFECDFAGTRDPERSSSSHWISIRESSAPERGYALSLVPPELNAACNISGNFFTLGPRTSFSEPALRKRALMLRHLHKDSGLRRYAALTLQALRERFGRV